MPCSVTFRQTARNCPIPTQRRLQTTRGSPVRPGDDVAVRLEETVEGFSPEEMPLSILYEDEALKLAVELLAALNG